MRGYILLTGLGFLAAIAVGVFVFFELRGLLVNYSNFSKKVHLENLEHINTNTLGAMTEYIVKRYPVLHDTEMLKRDAGEPWIWDIADEWHEIASIFKFAYIYYIEKSGDNYYFLLSSGIRRDEHPEWLGGPVWAETPPSIIEDAWQSGQFTISPDPIHNEWGTLISAEQPVIAGGKVVGILGIDYDISFLEDHVEEEKLLEEQEHSLLQRMRNILIAFIIIVIAFMWYQLWLSTKAVLVPIMEIEAEERLQLMIDSMAVSAFFFDLEGKLLDSNQRAVTLFGAKDKQELIDDFFKFSPEFQPNNRRSRDMVKENIEAAVRTGKEVFRWEHLKADGSPLPVEVTLTRVVWKDGFRIVSYFLDLSELVETEDMLRRVLATTEGSPHPTLFLGAGGDIEYMNPAVPEITGYSRKELQDNGLGLVFSPGDFELLNRGYIADALKGKPTNFEMKLITKDSTALDFAFSAYAIKMNDGSTGVGFLGRDITRLKEMQRELAAAKEQAEKALESEVQYNQAKSDLLSRVSHELRTPINAILGMTGIAKKTNEKNELDNCYNKIDSASTQLLALVDGILDMTSLDTGKFSLTPKPFDFNKAMDHVTGIAARNASAKGQLFKSTIDTAIPGRVCCDEGRLQQVLLTLLDNAVKFTPEKGAISLSAKMQENNGKECTLCFEVCDNGIGMDRETLGRIGETLEQADNSITRSYGGLGLGLSLSKRIVELMGGRLKAESETGKGSRFAFKLSLGVADVPLEGSSAALNLQGKKILVVDDVEINIEILAAVFEETGAFTESAKNGEEALKMFFGTKFDLVLLDLHMPVMDGYTAAKNMRSAPLDWAKTVPIIAVSAESGGDMQAKCRESGISDSLSKPIDPDTLFRKISQWLPG